MIQLIEGSLDTLDVEKMYMYFSRFLQYNFSYL